MIGSEHTHCGPLQEDRWTDDWIWTLRTLAMQLPAKIDNGQMTDFGHPDTHDAIHCKKTDEQMIEFECQRCGPLQKKEEKKEETFVDR